MRVFLRHRKVKFIYFVLKLSQTKISTKRTSDRDTSEQKNHSNKSALFVARYVLHSTDSSITPLLSRDATTQEGFGDFQKEANTLVSLSDLKHPLAVVSNNFRCSGNRVLRPDL